MFEDERKKGQARAVPPRHPLPEALAPGAVSRCRRTAEYCTYRSGTVLVQAELWRVRQAGRPAGDAGLGQRNAGC